MGFLNYCVPFAKPGNRLRSRSRSIFPNPIPIETGPFQQYPEGLDSVHMIQLIEIISGKNGNPVALLDRRNGFIEGRSQDSLETIALYGFADGPGDADCYVRGFAGALFQKDKFC